MNEYWILATDKRTPIRALNLFVWGEWFEKVENRLAAETDLPSGKRVTTVFLGLDHSFGNGPPLFWETAIHKPDPGKKEGFEVDAVERWSTYEEAIAGHEAVVKRESRVRKLTP